MATTLDKPQVIAQPFANAGDRATIPETSAVPGVASFTEGIPPECSLPIVGGGAYTRRTDINGLGYLATSLLYFLQNGGVFTYDANVATAIGGYPAGARLLTTIGGKTIRVISLVDNNSLNPATNLDGVNWANEEVRNIQSTKKTDASTVACDATWTDIPGLSVSITPVLSTSKVLVRYYVTGGEADGSSHQVLYRLVRDTTPIGVGDAAGSRIQAGVAAPEAGSGNDIHYASQEIMDSPATISPITYKIQTRVAYGTGNVFINRSYDDFDVTMARTISGIVAEEIYT